jgi:thiol-disulfide isomerase/thioredoxin
MRKLLFILLLMSTAYAQNGPSVGTILRTLSGRDLISGKVIEIDFKNAPFYTLLHFWNSKSDSCLKDFTKLVQMADDYKQKAVVFAFPYELKQDAVRTKELAAKYKMYWPQLMQYKQSAQGANVIDVLQVNEFPTYMLLDKQGVIIVRSGSLYDVEAVLKDRSTRDQ